MLANYSSKSLLTFFVLLTVGVSIVTWLSYKATKYEPTRRQRVKNPDRKTFQFSSSELVINQRAAPSPVTVVSVYIELNKSKHSIEKYDKWIDRMSKSVASPCAIVVNKAGYAKLRKLRANLTTKFYVVDDIWTVMRQLEIERNRSYIENYANVQNGLDPEKHIHNPNLYAVWNLKSYITHKIASEDDPFDSQFFIYTDAGAWRGTPIVDWPDTDFVVKKLTPMLANRVLFGQIGGFAEFRETSDIIEGTFFAGTKRAVGRFYEQFFEVHDRRLDAGLFVGKDQTTMNLVAFEAFPETVVRLKAWGLRCAFRVSSWFFYQTFLSRRPEPYCDHTRAEFLLDPETTRK